MSEWLDHPAVQAGVAPLVVALVVALALARSRYAWLAIIAGYATAVGLSTGFPFSPLTASRKIVLLGLLAPLAGIGIDRLAAGSRSMVAAVAGIAGTAAIWVVASVLAQREGTSLYIAAGGVAAFVAALTWLTLQLRDDGVRTAAAGLGLGIGVGVAAILSASIGFLIGGIAVAASAGALLLVQSLASRNIPAGFTGALPIALLTGMFAAGALMLASMPWYALPLMLLVPLAVLLPAGTSLHPILRAALLAFYALAAAALPIAAAWYSARGSFS